MFQKQPAGTDGRCVVEASVQRRAYLGEHWDYYVRPAGAAQPLRVTTPPQDLFEVDATVWIELDIGQMTVLR